MKNFFSFFFLFLMFFSYAGWISSTSIEAKSCPGCSQTMSRFVWDPDSKDLAFNENIHVTKHWSCSSCFLFYYESPCNSVGSYTCSDCGKELCFVCDSGHSHSTEPMICGTCLQSYKFSHFCQKYKCPQCGLEKIFYSSDLASTITGDNSEDQAAVISEMQNFSQDHEKNCVKKTCEFCGSQYFSSQYHRCSTSRHACCGGSFTVSVTSDVSDADAEEQWRKEYINARVEHAASCTSSQKILADSSSQYFGQTFVQVDGLWYSTSQKGTDGVYIGLIEAPSGSSPVDPDDPDDPDNPDNPDNPDDPDNPDNPDDPDNPDNPDDPDNPDNPDDPDEPDDPDNPDNPTPPDQPDTPSDPEVDPSPDVPDLPGGGKDYTGVLQSIDQELKKFRQDMKVTKTPTYTEKEFSDLPEEDRFDHFYGILEDRLIIDFDALKETGSSNLNLVFKVGHPDIYVQEINLDSLQDPSGKLSTFRGIIRTLLGFIFILCLLYAIILSLRQW